MKDFLLNGLVFSYGLVGIIALIGYIPTIKDLWIHKKMSSNIKSYFLWTLTSFITFLYSIFILQDFLFRIISGVNFISCLTILILSLLLSKKLK